MSKERWEDFFFLDQVWLCGFRLFHLTCSLCGVMKLVKLALRVLSTGDIKYLSSLMDLEELNLGSTGVSGDVSGVAPLVKLTVL